MDQDGGWRGLSTWDALREAQQELIDQVKGTSHKTGLESPLYLHLSKGLFLPNHVYRPTILSGEHPTSTLNHPKVERSDRNLGSTLQVFPHCLQNGLMWKTQAEMNAEFQHPGKWVGVRHRRIRTRAQIWFRCSLYHLTPPLPKAGWYCISCLKLSPLEEIRSSWSHGRFFFPFGSTLIVNIFSLILQRWAVSYQGCRVKISLWEGNCLPHQLPWAISECLLASMVVLNASWSYVRGQGQGCVVD